MPHGIYNLMWEHLKAEEEFFGYIVNRNKDNSYYWALINVTPFYDQEKLSGYFSVCRAPTPESLNIIKPLYRGTILVYTGINGITFATPFETLVWRNVSCKYIQIGTELGNGLVLFLVEWFHKIS